MSIKGKEVTDRLLILSFVFILIQTAACSSTQNISRDEGKYSAYGQKWKYSSILQSTRQWNLFTSHGNIGRVERVRQELILDAEDGEKIPVHERLYALQRDGSYKKVACCIDNNTLGDVFSINDEIFVRFLQERTEITDCFVHPPWKPDSDRQPLGEQTRWTEFYGEFDPVTRNFNIQTFNKGTNLEPIKGPEWKKWWAAASLAESVGIEYLHRSPFVCSTEPPAS